MVNPRGREPAIWFATAKVVALEVQRLGKSPELLFARAGVPLDLQSDPFSMVPLKNFVSLFEEAARFTGDADLGLRCGGRISPFDFGPLGLFFVSSANLGDALSSFCQNINVMQDGCSHDLVIEGDLCHIRYRIEEPDILARRQDAEFSLSAVANLIKYAVGSHWNPAEVHFEHQRPRALLTHQRVFGAPIYFRQKFNALVFPKATLGWPCNTIDKRMYPLMQHYASLMGRKSEESRSPVQKIESMLSDHFSDESPDLSIQNAAHQVGMSKRSLQRAFKRQGETFSKVKTEKRQVLTQHYLGQQDLSITEIAYMLSYADAACFTRACRRWFGMSPSEYRRQLLAAEKTV